MKRLLLCTLLGSSLMLLASTPSASFYSQDEYRLAHSMFDSVQADLASAQTHASGDVARIKRTRADLDQLEQGWDRARFDSRQMAAAISDLRTVADDRRFQRDDRAALSMDLSRLLDFQTDYY